MSDSEQQQVQDQEDSQEQEQEQSQQEEQDSEQDGSDQEQNSDEDEDEDEDEDQDEDSNESGSGEQDSEKDESKQNEDSHQVSKFVPTFKPVSEEFVFKNLLADIASIGNSVDHFISSLSSTGGSGYRSQPRSYIERQKSYEFKHITPVEEKKYTIMKDEDIQVSMQPQIVIQQAVVSQQQPKQEAYKMSNESTKFLSKLYEENKKLKKFQNSQTGTLGTNIWSKSQERFSRPDHERGLINLDDRNKEIDEAIQMLRRE